MIVLITSKNEEDSIKNEGTSLRLFTTLYIDFFRCSRTDNYGVRCGIWPKFELIQTFMHVIVTCKNEDDSIKNEGASVVTTLFPL